MLQRIESKLVLSVRNGRNGELVDFSNARNPLLCIKQQYGLDMYTVADMKMVARNSRKGGETA